MAPFISGWRKQKLRTAHTVRLNETGEVVYVASGIGREPGIIAAEVLVKECAPDVLISGGFAGALTTGYKAGDEVVVGVVVDSSTGESFRTESSSTTRVVSSGFIANRSEKLELNRRFEAEAVDMEGASVGLVAKRHGIPFYAIKTISDELNFRMLPFAEFVDAAGNFNTRTFLGHVALRPSYWPQLVQMGRNAQRAATRLRSGLQHLIREIQESQATPIS